MILSRPVFSASFDSSDPVQLWFDIDRTFGALAIHLWGLSTRLGLSRHYSDSSIQTKFISTFNINSYLTENDELVARFEKLVKRAFDLGIKPTDLHRLESLLDSVKDHTNYFRTVYNSGPLTPEIKEGIRDIYGRLLTLTPFFRDINDRNRQISPSCIGL